MNKKLKNAVWIILGWVGFIITCFVYYAAIAPIITLIFR
jgi:hypothetical protein